MGPSQGRFCFGAGGKSRGGLNNDADCTTNRLDEQFRGAPTQPTRGLAMAWDRRDRPGAGRLLANPTALGAGGDERCAGSGATSIDPGACAATDPGCARGANNVRRRPGGQADHRPGRHQARRHADRRRRRQSSRPRSSADHGLLLGRHLRTAVLESSTTARTRSSRTSPSRGPRQTRIRSSSNYARASSSTVDAR